MNRNLLACDACHKLKAKCVHAVAGCFRCQRLELPCTFSRDKPKRGRRPKYLAEEDASLHSPSTSTSDGCKYPVLEILAPYHQQHEADNHFIPSFYSNALGSKLLDHFFSSPNQEFHTRIIRRRNLLDLQNPRRTTPALLLSILCLSCYMPVPNGKSLPVDLSSAEFVLLRRRFLSVVLQLMKPVFGSSENVTFDDVLTTSMLVHIGTSEDRNETHVPFWLSMLKFMVLQQRLYVESKDLDAESAEERRRLWWATWIVDRHSALSFNLRTQLTEVSCQNLRRPVPDTLWESSEPLSQIEGSMMIGANHEVFDLDLFGVFIPLSYILGEILEYHFLRQHSTFGSSHHTISLFQRKIEVRLEEWANSFQMVLKFFMEKHQPLTLADYAERRMTDTNTTPHIAMYAEHMYHCMWILLYGKLDLGLMYGDTEWLSSTEFLKAGDHAVYCAKIAADILVIDPHLRLYYRYFGTYLLQSSFVLLIIVQKLGKRADEYITSHCTANLHVLDAFVEIANMSYQRTFVRALRRILSHALSREPGAEDEHVLDSEILKYRWTSEYTGLWSDHVD
ncbi:hypothetical protein V502_03051 [Pseudogymnoascus sp. VKM F-4520 (FW-2644)]|nr:hypothetical protein V502_03051 [Pseudogymnoascus sp. VKM F-4520 (FW-2644)]